MMRILRRIRNKSMVVMTMITVLLLGINFVLVEHHRQLRGQDDGLTPVIDARDTNVTNELLNEPLVPQYVPAQPQTDVETSINVIMGYMRTGSSFLGNTIQEYPGTFYLYEPIRNTWEAFYYGRQPLTPILYPNGSIIEHKLEDKDSVILQEIRDYMSCNFANVSVMSLKDKFHRSKTKNMKDLKECTEKYTSDDDNTSIPLLGIKEWVECLEDARKLCLEAPIRLLKFIRIPLMSMGPLVAEIPNLKILHLHRDPRAVFHSRAQLDTTPQKATTEEVVEHCDQWLTDLETAKVMTEEHPDKYHSLRYEDVTEHPVEAFTEICKYFNVPFEPVVKDYLVEITTAEEDNGPWQFKRKNPYETAMKWRQQLPFERASDIGKICEKPMNEMNYIQFDTAEAMTNLRIPVRGPLEIGGPTWKVTEE